MQAAAWQCNGPSTLLLTAGAGCAQLRHCGDPRRDRWVAAGGCRGAGAQQVVCLSRHSVACLQAQHEGAATCTHASAAQQKSPSHLHAMCTQYPQAPHRKHVGLLAAVYGVGARARAVRVLCLPIIPKTACTAVMPPAQCAVLMLLPVLFPSPDGTPWSSTRSTSSCWDSQVGGTLAAVGLFTTVSTATARRPRAPTPSLPAAPLWPPRLGSPPCHLL